MAVHKTLGLFTLLAALLPATVLHAAAEVAETETTARQSTGASRLRLNQLGFPSAATKIAVVLAAENPTAFSVHETQTGKQVFTGTLQRANEATWAGEHSWIADFSRLSQSGDYYLEVTGIGRSRPFRIQPHIYRDLAAASLKAFYFQRASIALDETHVGRWARAAGHPDNRVAIHASAASDRRPAGTLVSAPHGWYDAGDYNKYVVNSGITMSTLMSVFERYPQYFSAQTLNIPESGNALPDILDEVHYNLVWLAAMQDASDGGVYHKLTTANFEGMVAPHKAVQPRYLVQKTTAATLDFAAVMAQASRVFADYHPDAAKGYRQAAEHAWRWAQKNPAVHYRQETLNRAFDPDITTGAYGDEQLADERDWAAAELFLATGKDEYWQVIAQAPLEYVLPTWADVRWLGYYGLINSDRTAATPDGINWRNKAVAALVGAAAQLQESGEHSAYQAPMTGNRRHFVWGSNAVAANQGILMLEAHRLTGEQRFLRGAEATLDYLLGRNATGYSYVTGFGHKPPQHPHHRLTAARPDLPPFPGLLVGGPNPAQQDGCTYPSDVADQSYSDTQCSYASNEIAINWNAPLAYLVNGLDALEEKANNVNRRERD